MVLIRITLKCFPAINAKFPFITETPFIAEEYHAEPHISPTTMRIPSNGGHSFQSINQPPNFPDFNILDLGYFNSIQNVQYKTVTRSID